MFWAEWLDVQAIGTAVFATADGKIEKSQYSTNSGNYILINCQK